MKIQTTRKDHGPFQCVDKTITATLKGKLATLRCNIQKGVTPMGRNYKMRPQWWVKFQGSPCAMGPWSADSIRKHLAA